MANLRNEFEFRSALLTALGQEHTEAEAKNEEMWRRKMLDGLGVEYDQNDVNQFGLFREKLIEGVTSKSEGGGGSSDFSTATMTVNGNFTPSDLFIAPVIEKDPNKEDVAFPLLSSGNSTYTVILYKGRSVFIFMGSRSRTITVSGNIETSVETADMVVYIITGDCTITIS